MFAIYEVNNVEIIMKKTELKVGDIVQIRPNLGSFFDGCFMVITEPKSWGAQGYIPHPQQNNEDGSVSVPYFRCKFEDMEFVGKAVWVLE
jgi:hypothetical protein